MASNTKQAIAQAYADLIAKKSRLPSYYYEYSEADSEFYLFDDNLIF